MSQTELTLAHFVSRLKRIVSKVAKLDAGGADHALRLTVSFSLYTQFDALRCQERSFDRPAFAERVSAVEHLLRVSPRWAATTPSTRVRRPAEEFVAELYSRCWSHYDDETFRETIGLFEERFRLNRVDLSFLRDADCLDAGCGSGRYTMAMARLGAKHAIGIDISERAVREAAQRSERLGFGRSVRFIQGSVIDMPREWAGKFGFVCSNGVVHHTTNPTKGLQEIFRVLKPGGQAYIFIYGAGGLFWELVDAIRALVKPVPLEVADAWLQSLGVTAGKIFNALDHWYTPMQERLTEREFQSRLEVCGFEKLTPIPRAKVYDASERKYRFSEERDLVGEGDLRYLVTRPQTVTGRRAAGRSRLESAPAR